MLFTATERSAIVDVPVVFGGTFDPIHRGHIRAAKTVSRLLGDVPVQMMLAGYPRLRDNSPESIAHRWHMLRLACADERNLIPNASETCGERATQTIETIQKLGGVADRPVIWALGDDAAANMPRWIQFETIREKASILVLNRTKACLAPVRQAFELVKHPTDLARKAGRMFVIEEPGLDVSATTIRNEIRKEKKSVESWLHPDVLSYIIDMHLYRT